MSEVTGKEMITRFLDRMAITARVGVENGEFTKDDILWYIQQYGNKRISETLNMRKKDFMLLALGELIATSREIEEMEGE